MRTFTFAPRLTFLKVWNSGLPAVVRTRRRAMPVVGAGNVTGTPAPNARAVTTVGAVTAAIVRRGAGGGAPTPGTPAAGAAPPAAAPAAGAPGGPADARGGAA